MEQEWKFLKSGEIFSNVSDKKHDGNSEVLSATQDKGIIPRSCIDIDIKYDKANTVNYKKVCKGNFVISLRSFQGGIEYSEYNGIISPAYTVLSAKKEICNIYYKEFFKSEEYIKRLNKAVYGIRDGKNISYDDFSMIYIPFPPIEEQEKIAEILLAQDKLIALEQKLIDQKKQQKKCLMQNLLTGKIRLKGFEGEWNKVKLEKIFLSINSGKPIKNEENGLYSIYGSTGEIGKANSYDYNENIIIVARVGANAGKVYKICNKCKISDNALLIRINKSNSFLFIFYLLCQINLHNLVFGSGQPLITSGHIKKILTYVPSFKEQTAIAEILSAQDKEIELLEKQLEQEKLKKKALMQMLLTGKVRVKI